MLTRRAFSTLAASSLAFAQRRDTPPETKPFEAPLTFTRQPLTLKIQPFPMTQVRLAASPFKDAADANRAYMDRLSADRLVQNFRLNAGLPSSAA
ncbi:MAG: hypothetical protein ABSF22_14870, partial [Bryobacteraceae bacterium]